MTFETPFIQETLEKETGIIFQPALTLNDLQTALAIHINNLIVHNFDKLIFLLYRIDIPEKKIQQLLHQNKHNTTAGETIAQAIITRQLEKIELRKKYTPPSTENNTQEEKW